MSLFPQTPLEMNDYNMIVTLGFAACDENWGTPIALDEDMLALYHASQEHADIGPLVRALTKKRFPKYSDRFETELAIGCVGRECTFDPRRFHQTISEAGVRLNKNADDLFRRNMTSQMLYEVGVEYMTSLQRVYIKRSNSCMHN